MTDTQQVQDFLDVDAPITGQNYVLLSFLSPEDMIRKKELFLMHQFLKTIYEKEESREEPAAKPAEPAAKPAAPAEAAAEPTDAEKSSEEVPKEPVQHATKDPGYYSNLKHGYRLPETFKDF